MKKRILFLTIDFYEYIPLIEKNIQSEMNAMVDTFILTSKCKGLYYFIDKCSQGNFSKKVNNQRQEKFFSKIKNIEYDYIFVLVGRELNIDAYKIFVHKQKKAIKILYLWDDIKRIKEFFYLKDEFDRIYTFDKNDSIKYNLSFLPLFYNNAYIYKNEKKIYDFSIIGFLHSDRENVLKKILTLNFKKDVIWYALLKTTRKHRIMDIINSKKYEKKFYLNYKTLSMKETANIIKKSKITIDIPHPGQTGLSIRTFEALAAHTKIITTNENITEYDFFNMSNICVIDRNNPIIDENFLKQDFIPIFNFDKYSIENWVKFIFYEEK